MQMKRTAGILLHPTSLPGPFGIGDVGPHADAFLDFLAGTGQAWWQILPIGPTGAGNSPYQAHSSFAGNPLLISPERMAEHGFIPWDRLERYRLPDASQIDFGAVNDRKEQLFREAFALFSPQRDDFQRFLHTQAEWLEDFSLYMALKRENGGAAWMNWEPALATRDPNAIAEAKDRLEREMLYHKFVQYLFALQWRQFRDGVRRRNIRLIGDLPIYVSSDSADVWARPDLFELDKFGKPTVVAGVPPDLFEPEKGQLWGNPIYRWEAHKAEGYSWWISRLKATLDHVDLLRLDHFRGFEAYWEIPASAPTAATGRWVPGPGADFLEAARQALGGLPLIAEDLGVITPEVEALRDGFDLPGMKVLQFAFGGGSDNSFLPHRHIVNCVVYTGTHDNDTTVGWYHCDHVAAKQSPEQRAHEQAFFHRYAGARSEPLHWTMNRLAFGSIGATAILPIQDVLGLDHSARMNTPGQAEGQWTWRLLPGQIDHQSTELLREITYVYERWNN